MKQTVRHRSSMAPRKPPSVTPCHADLPQPPKEESLASIVLMFATFTVLTYGCMWLALTQVTDTL
jgi:hypothetical protein